MSLSYVSTELRQQVIERAGNCCEYCRVSQEHNLFRFHIDHIIAEKHGGTTTLDNLCLSCQYCNTFKGSDIASMDWETDKVIQLYHPRKQNWRDHFRLMGALIEPITDTGRVTVSLLRINREDQVIERQGLIDLGLYPC